MEINVSVTKNRTTNFSVLIFVHVKNLKKKRPPLLFSFENPKSKSQNKEVSYLAFESLTNATKETQNFNFQNSCCPAKDTFFCNKKLNLNIFVTLFEHSTSMHHQEIASSNMTKDRRQQSRVKRHSIYIRTVNS